MYLRQKTIILTEFLTDGFKREQSRTGRCMGCLGELLDCSGWLDWLSASAVYLCFQGSVACEAPLLCWAGFLADLLGSKHIYIYIKQYKAIYVYITNII